MDKYKSSFLSNCYEWLFTDEERNPIGFIATFLLIIIVSLVIQMLAIPIIYKLVQ